MPITAIPKGQVAVNFAALTRRFPEIPQTRMGLRVAPAAVPALISALQDKFGLDGRNLLDQATLKAESTADLQPHLRGDRGAERLHPWRRRHRTADQPVDPEQFPPAAARAAMGDRNHAAAACGDRTAEDHVGGADHDPAGAAAGLAGGVVPDRGRQCQSVRLAAAVSMSSRCNCSASGRGRMLAALLAALLPVLKLARMQPASLIRIFADER